MGGCQKQVHRNLTELDDIGVIEFKDGDTGQAKIPTLASDGLKIDTPFARLNGNIGTAVP